ncbi:hypothetical protein [Rickettsiella endosymbiont of Miltochrista miniata]|uniref:hypothetical protein n=1 Tax=Rickettsiella endosymbiont of Miltochrista miniata TaxID=3066239 RepID=UPI00313E5E97
MIPSKNNPALLSERSERSLKTLNDFTDFVSAMEINVTESTHFKKDAIKIINCLKFIKINLAFIGYAVENRSDPQLYTYETDKAKGVIRDFHNTSIHLNSYHTKEDVQSALENLVQQFENAIEAMQALGKLELFARQLQFDRDIGCIEARTAKALLFAAVCMSSPSHSLDQLMAQCLFMPEDDETEILKKANAFFKPFIGQVCIWKNKDYIIDEVLIKQYLTEAFGIKLPSKEFETIKNLFENFTFLEKITWLKGSLPIKSFEVCTLLLEEIEKINKIESSKLNVIEKLGFFWEHFIVSFDKFRDSFVLPLFVTITAIAGIALITIGLIFLPGLVLGLSILCLTLCLTLTCIREGNLIENFLISGFFFSCPLLLSAILMVMAAGVIVSAVISLVTFISNKRLESLVPNQELLFTQCIDDYFEGKGNILSGKLIHLFEDHVGKKSELTEKETAVLRAIEIKEENFYFTKMNAHEIWQKGVKSWNHYRYLRENNDLVTQVVLMDLLSINRLFQGSTSPFYENGILQQIANYPNAFKEIDNSVSNNKVLAKVIKPKDYPLFIKQLENLNYRAHLRKPIANPTHKFVHLSGEIVTYIKKKCPNKEYTHTKKTSTTLLSSLNNTLLFGERHNIASNLVGFLFDQEKCKIKARLTQDSGTYNHGWIGNKPTVLNYQTYMRGRNEIDEEAFIIKIQETDQTNEVLAQLNKDALLAIVIGQDTDETRNLAITRQNEIKEKFSIVLPIIFYSSSEKSIKLYEWKEILYEKYFLERKKQNLLKLHQDCLAKHWNLGFFSRTRIAEKRVPKAVCFLNDKIDELKSYKQNDYYRWARAALDVKDEFNRKSKQNTFFRFLCRRSQDTVAFYQNAYTQQG